MTLVRGQSLMGSLATQNIRECQACGSQTEVGKRCPECGHDNERQDCSCEACTVFWVEQKEQR